MLLDIHKFFVDLSSVKCVKSAPKKSNFMSVSSLNTDCIWIGSALPLTSDVFCSKSLMGLANTLLSMFSSIFGRGLSLGAPGTELREAVRTPGVDLKLVFSKIIVFTGGVLPSRRFLSGIWEVFPKT